MRFGYGLSYNSGTYSTIARHLYQQPPFFLTGTSLGIARRAAHADRCVRQHRAEHVTNNYGIDKNYQLGLIHQWSADYSRDLFKTWSVGATYFGTRGGDLDMLRAPNRGPTGFAFPVSSRSRGSRPTARRTRTAASPAEAADEGRGRHRDLHAVEVARQHDGDGRQRRPSRRTIRISPPSGRRRTSISATSCRRQSSVQLPWGMNRNG